jgi:uncharacterized protein YraI
MNTWKCSLLSASIVALSTGWAAAGPAVVLDYLNLRLGPGYDYAVIAVIPAGWPVDAGGCAAGWCQVTVRGIAGYVDANYLGVASNPVVAYAAPPYYWSYGFYNGPYTDWTYPYRDYYTVGYDPFYPYYRGYYGVRYLSPFAGDYAQARDADITIDRRPSDRGGRAAVAKNGAAVAPNVSRSASASLTTGAAPPAVRRRSQNPAQ